MPRPNLTKIKKLKKVLEILKKLPKIIAANLFLAFLSLAILVFAFGGLVFYKYGILIEKTEPTTVQQPLNFDDKDFQEILQIWAGRQQRLLGIDAKTYLNPFKGQATSSKLTK